MIIVCLKGGLGNQMFQYAAGRNLALRHGVPLKLDLSSFEGNQAGSTPRRFALDCFAIEALKAPPWEVMLMTGRGGSLCKTATARLIGLFCSYWSYRERRFQYDPDLMNLPDNVYLEGYWQSERYFCNIHETIRREFSLKEEPDGKNRELADLIGEVNSVALHVRRGDYVENPVANASHGVCELSYYNNAVKRVVQRVENPVFFVFSDDPGWCKENLLIPFQTHYLDHNGEQPHEDLRLMSLCRNHIISNSSFGWWGAWLSSNQDKIVIAPKKWFNDPTINTDDVVPVGWQLI